MDIATAHKVSKELMISVWIGDSTSSIAEIIARTQTLRTARARHVFRLDADGLLVSLSDRQRNWNTGSASMLIAGNIATLHDYSAMAIAYND